MTRHRGLVDVVQLMIVVHTRHAPAPFLLDPPSPAVAERRDPNDVARLGGAEAAEYRKAGLPHGPANAPFRSIDELARVAGTTDAILDIVRPAATTHGLPRPDRRSAPDLALKALGGVARRQESAPVAGTGSDGAALDALGSVTGHAFSIAVTAALPDGGRTARYGIVCVTGGRTAPYWVLEWR